ncbi:MAG: aldose epimerase family protein [Oscillospiraceae bacterium]
MITITKESFGKLKTGEEVSLFRMTNCCGSYIEVLDYGCTLKSICVPNRLLSPVDVCLSYDSIAEYEEQDGYLGAVVGRHANRIGNGKFELNGKKYSVACNNGPNHLHGGIRGFDKYIWQAHTDETGVSFSRLSPDGEEGYPGNLNVCVRYGWSENNELSIHYTADTDADTVINLTNHCYFNLNGGGTALEHVLWVNSHSFCENDSNCLPTGRVVDTADCPAMDFTLPKSIGRDINMDDINLKNAGGYDHNYILSERGDNFAAAMLTCPQSGIDMTVSTTLPGIQVYSANFLTERRGKNGSCYSERDAVCLETQFFPNGLACGFEPAPVLKKGDSFDETTRYSFSLV